MASPRTFAVTLYPIYRSRHNPEQLVIIFEMFSRSYPTKRFEANSTAEVLGVVQRFAQEHGSACDASVRLIEGRKPSGFDAATKRLRYNLEKITLEPGPSAKRQADTAAVA